MQCDGHEFNRNVACYATSFISDWQMREESNGKENALETAAVLVSSRWHWDITAIPPIPSCRGYSRHCNKMQRQVRRAVQSAAAGCSYVTACGIVLPLVEPLLSLFRRFQHLCDKSMLVVRMCVCVGACMCVNEIEYIYMVTVVKFAAKKL